MRTVIKVLMGVVIAALFSGCGATGKQFNGFVKPADNNGIVYIYRPSNLEVAALDQIVYDVTNNRAIGQLANNGYITYKTKPGNITIAISANPGAGHSMVKLLLFNSSTLDVAQAIDPSDKPKRVFTINVKPNKITCLRWSASTISDIPNGIVNNETCKNEIIHTKLSINK
jgi:hypothetical protein